MTTREILLEAAKIVRTGWTQGKYMETIFGKKCYCALGALSRAYSDAGYKNNMVPLHEVERALSAEINDTKYQRLTIAKWNDRGSQTAENVATAMERAAARCSS